jgi:hypothetical protein
MLFKAEIFKNMPFSGKVGASLFAGGWISIIAFSYFKLPDTNWALKLFIMVCILSPFLLQAQNWARWIAILGNVMGILLSVYFFMAGFVQIAAMNVVLFGGSIYYLMLPATSRYFRTHSQSGR